MALSVVSLAAYSVGSSIDQKTISYFFQASVAAGNYQLGGIPLNFAGNVFAPGASASSYPIEVSFRSLSTPPSVYTYKFNPLGNQVSNITNLALTSNVVTITANNTLATGSIVYLTGLTTSTFLNGTYQTVISTGLSGTAFEFNFTHANVSTGAETGTAAVAVVDASQPSGFALVPVGPNSGNIQVFTGTSEQAGGATPAAVVADIILCTAKFRRG